MADREEMKEAGFLEFEINALAPHMPPDVPYFQEMLSERRQERQMAIEWAAVTEEDWEQHVKDLYEDCGWEDPWQMLRDWEDKHRDKNPEYESPSKERKKKKDAQEFDRKYPAGIAYPRKGGRR